LKGKSLNFLRRPSLVHFQFTVNEKEDLIQGAANPIRDLGKKQGITRSQPLLPPETAEITNFRTLNIS
jgi:hypothetical protein